MRVLATLLLGGMIVGPAPSAATGVEAGSPYEILAQRFFESGEELARVMRKLPLNCSALGVVVFSSNATARGAVLGALETLRRGRVTTDPDLAEFISTRYADFAGSLPSSLASDYRLITNHIEKQEGAEYEGRSDLLAALETLRTTIEDTQVALAVDGIE
jgi:hypothetical protein